VDEDRLSPELGRLIDEAKAAARALGVDSAAAEGVALLSDEGDIYVGAAQAPASPSAAHQALERAQEAGAGEILAAAVAAPYDPADTVVASVASYERLVGLDPDLPLVVKRHGRWVMLPASELTPVS
jgi:hypothetical protein